MYSASNSHLSFGKVSFWPEGKGDGAERMRCWKLLMWAWFMLGSKGYVSVMVRWFMNVLKPFLFVSMHVLVCLYVFIGGGEGGVRVDTFWP